MNYLSGVWIFFHEICLQACVKLMLCQDTRSKKKFADCATANGKKITVAVKAERIFALNFNWRGLLSISIQSNIFFRRDSWWRCPCHCKHKIKFHRLSLTVWDTSAAPGWEALFTLVCMRAQIVCKVNPPDEERLPKSGLFRPICAWIASSWIHLHKLSSAAYECVANRNKKDNISSIVI